MDGAISGEDIRRAENFDPSGQPAANEILIPVNMMPASAFRPDGMTVLQLSKAALDLLKAGYEAASVNTFLGLGDLAHTGLVPGTTTPEPSEANDAPADDSTSTRFLNEQLLALLEREVPAPTVTIAEGAVRVDVHAPTTIAEGAFAVTTPPVTLANGAFRVNVVQPETAAQERSIRKRVKHDAAGRITEIIEERI
jgi:hypothetical protein